MGLINTGDPTSGAALYELLKSRLESSTQESSHGDETLFIKAFRYEAIALATSNNLNLSEVTNV